MIFQVTVVFVLLAHVLGAERGTRCTNQWGEKATCTNIYSCKAAMDAIAIANGSALYAAGIVCGYDTEPLVCCRTPADFDETPVNNIAESNIVIPTVTSTTEAFSNTNSDDLNIFTNVSAFNDSGQVVLELSNNNLSSADVNNATQISDIFKPQPSGFTEPTTDIDDERISSNNKQATTSTTSLDEVIFTSPPIEVTSEKTSVVPPNNGLADRATFIPLVPTLGVVDSTTINSLVPPKPSQVPDALPLQSNNTSDSIVIPDISRFPEVPNSSAFPEVPSNILPEIPLSVPYPPPIFTESSISTGFTTEVYINKVLPDRNKCGFQLKRNRLADSPIASIDEFPWVALLRYQDAYGYDAGFRCVGTLINNRHVITSAHCVVIDQDLFKLKSVRLGEWSISYHTDCVFDYDYKREECPDKVVDVGISENIPHPSYDPNTGNNIALIRLERKVEYTDYIRPICLPVEDLQAPSDRTILTTSGWGATKSGCLLDIKSKIHLPALSKNKCSNTVFWYMRVLEGQVCVDATSGKDICKTDSGGPLMVLDEQDKPQWYLEGVIPEGFYCDKRGLLGVYTRVNKYIAWILYTLGQD